MCIFANDVTPDFEVFEELVRSPFSARSDNGIRFHSDITTQSSEA
jgi:hypothetical protein